MIADLKPYATMKDSEVPWLGEVPEHWEVLPNRALFSEVKERECADEQMLSVTITQGIIKQRALLAGSSKKDSSNQDKSAYKLVCLGDIAYNKMRAWQGAVGVSMFRGIVSPAYVVVRVRNHDNSHYFHHLLRTPAFAKEAERWSYGITSDMWSLRPEHFKMIYCSRPPVEEQAAIARFIDHADRRIRRYIRTKQKLIKLLEERKQAIIHRAVTRGLDPNVRLKPSGVEWLGEVPEHWELRRAKQVCTAIVDCKNRTPDMFVDGAFTVVRTTNIRNGCFSLVGSYPTNQANYEIWTQRGAPRAGDVFFTREAPAGEACLVPNLNNLCMGQRMMYFRPNAEMLDAQFLLHTIYGPIVRTYIEVECNGSTVGHLRLGQVTALPILWCSIEEQRRIVAYIDEAVAPIAIAISRAQQEVSLLREYRTRLIADVVTGKLDVRAAAANLPDEADEPEAPDDTDTLGAGDEPAAGDLNVAPEEAEA